MKITLYGSTTSPFVRRVRILLESEQRDYDFTVINIFDTESRQRYQKMSPSLRVPFAEIDGEVIGDSYLICKRLLGKEISLEQEKALFLINEINDAGVTLVQLKLFGVDKHHQSKIAQHARDRVNAILTYFEQIAVEQSLVWDVVGIWLYCMLDWMMFRQIIQLDEAEYPGLFQFYQQYKDDESVVKTSP